MDLTLYADGGTVGGSPGSSGVYWSVATGEQVLVSVLDTTGRRRLAAEAEYLAVLEALAIAAALRPHRLVLRTDYQPLVRHWLSGQPPRSRLLAGLFQLVQFTIGWLAGQGTTVQLEWVGRETMEALIGH